MDHDLIIIGSGAAGLGAARIGQWSKADTLMVTDGPPGGDCTFTGCVPSKTLLSAARDGLGFVEAMTRVRLTVERIAATETSDVLREHGTHVVDGRGRLATHDTVVVGERRITASRILIATGGRPAIPPIPGLEGIAFRTNETLFDLEQRPTTLGIIGGGPVGCEMAEAFTRLGTSVTLFESEDRVLPREEPQASSVVDAALRLLGVDIRTSTAVERVDGAIRIYSSSDPVEVDELLVAVGRVPNTAGLALDELGVTVDDRGFIQTDRRLETSVNGVYAAGDVTGKLPLTHAADEMGRIAASNALGKGYGGRYSTDHTPWVTFTSPEVARVGVTEAEAVSMGGMVAYLPMSEMDRAITDGAEDGFIKLIAAPKWLTRRLFGGRIIGATIVAPRAGEMINEIALLMRSGSFAGRLAQTVHAYPTWGYGIQKAAGQFMGPVEGREARAARAP
ncbi:MAG: FAD-dependent oxidoreductase [Acidimicrobiales bacterium]|nr:FAD-dependent oxidoreductase [Acidimicrobiales bacterium]